MALRDRPQLWFLRDTRDQTFHLLLLGTGATVQPMMFLCRKNCWYFRLLFLADSEVKWQFLGWLRFSYLSFWVSYMSVTYISDIRKPSFHLAFLPSKQNQVRESWSHRKADSVYLKIPVELHRNESRWPPSWELTYHPKMAFWRWFSFSQGWDMLIPWRVATPKRWLCEGDMINQLRRIYFPSGLYYS